MILKKLKPTSASSAPARSGHSDRLLTGKDLKRKGAKFINLMLTAKNDRNLTNERVAEILGIAESYWNKLQYFVKPVSGLGSDVIRRAARFLNMDYVSTLLAADILEPSDFYIDPSIIDVYLPRAIRWIQTDPKYAGWASPKLAEQTRDDQLFFVKLYEDATGHALIPGRMTPEKILQRYGELTSQDPKSTPQTSPPAAAKPSTR